MKTPEFEGAWYRVPTRAVHAIANEAARVLAREARYVDPELEPWGLIALWLSTRGLGTHHPPFVIWNPALADELLEAITDELHGAGVTVDENHAARVQQWVARRRPAAKPGHEEPLWTPAPDTTVLYDLSGGPRHDPPEAASDPLPVFQAAMDEILRVQAAVGVVLEEYDALGRAPADRLRSFADGLNTARVILLDAATKEARR